MVIPDDEKSGEQKLREEIEALKTKIKNTEYDLSHMFKGNGLIKQKLLISKKQLDEKQKLLAELTGQEVDKTQQIRKKEDEITEKSDSAASKEQEEFLDEIIEEEFI